MSEQDIQPTPATEGEDAPKATDDMKELADAATELLDKDRVTRAQAVAYTELLTSGPTGDPLADFLPEVSVEDAIAYANKSKTPPTELRDNLRLAYSDLKPSHQWLKAFIATAVVLHEQREEAMEAEEEPEAPKK